MFDHAPLMTHVQQDLLGGDTAFPICFQLSLSIRKALSQPNVHVSEVARLIEVEPLMAVKLVHIANCVTFNPYGRTVFNIEQAIHRVGLNVARSLAVSIAVEQIKRLPSMSAYLDIADATWGRSVYVAVLLRQLSKSDGLVNPDEAMLCGLVSEMGVFYLLHRAANMPAYSNDMHKVLDLLREHSCDVGIPLLMSLGVPQDIITALQPTAAVPHGSNAWYMQALLVEARRLQALPTPVPADEPRAQWLQAAQHHLDELRNLL